MSRIEIEESVAIARSPEDVWSMVQDYSSDHRWRPGITEMTPDPPGPPAVGTKVREVLRQGGRDYVTESVVTTSGPGMEYRFSGVGTVGRVQGGRTVVPAGDGGSAFTYLVQIEPKGSMRLLRPIVARTMRKSLRADLVRLRDLLEGGDTPAS